MFQEYGSSVLQFYFCWISTKLERRCFGHFLLLTLSCHGVSEFTRQYETVLLPFLRLGYGVQ